jgi:tetratricopeptide repeat protein
VRSFAFILLVAALSWTEEARAEDTAAMARADTLFAHEKWREAAGAYRDVARHDPSSLRAWTRLGSCCASLSRWDDAVAAYHRAEALSGRPVFVQYNLACAYARSARPDSAFAVLDRVMNGGYRQPGALQGDPDLVSLKGDPRFAALVERADRNARPCAFTPESRQFDFWIGDWEVHDNQRGHALAGTSHVDLILGECVIFENWSGVYGGHGKSLNAWNKACACWQQSWMDDAGTVTLYTDGHLVNDALVLVADKDRPAAQGGMRRLSFFDLGKDRVRQLAESSSDGGRTWVTTYDFDYLRKKLEADAGGAAGAAGGNSAH